MAASQRRQAHITGKVTKAEKIIFLGGMAVGKTSLVQRLVFNEFSDQYESTIGGAFASKVVQVNGANIKCSLWDTAGQERFNSFASLYFRDASAAIVVYDISNLKTLEDAKKWIQELRLMAPVGLVIMLAGNKSDLAINRKVVQTQTGLDVANDNGLMFAEISAKSGVGVEKMFTSLAFTNECVVKAIVAKHHGNTVSEDDERVVTLNQTETTSSSSQCEC